jgi:hypothetical protein
MSSLVKFVSLGVSICLDMVSIETLDLDTFKSWSRQVLKTGLDCRDEVSTKSRHGLCPKVSIFVKVSIETLDLDAKKVSVSTVEKFSTVSKTGLDR